MKIPINAKFNSIIIFKNIPVIRKTKIVPVNRSAIVYLTCCKELENFPMVSSLP